MSSTVSLGWDVGGWLGKKQAVAVVRHSSGSSAPEWLGISDQFRLAGGQPIRMSSLLPDSLGDEVVDALSDADRVAVAIDAPLAFSDGFRNHLLARASIPSPPTREIESLLAYRECERWVAAEFWKPLSAAFDKLGNNATLAIAVSRRLQAAGYGVVPFETGPFTHEVIEVYPGIVKEAKRTAAAAIPPVHALLPEHVEQGTDRYDAAICGLLGLLHAVGGSPFGLPNLVGPPDDFPRTDSEGGIYGLPADFVLGFH